jgi:AcrR family transcriptional regulator
MKPRRTQAARSQATRDQIVQAALTVFALKGYAAASMDDICLAAGCSKGGLYHHFAAKPAVLSAVVDRLAASGDLLPSGEPEFATPLGRVLVDIWAEAARDDGLRAQLQAGYAALATGDGCQGDVARLLQVGTLIQLLTRGEQVDAERIAAHLGIERAA